MFKVGDKVTVAWDRLKEVATETEYKHFKKLLTQELKRGGGTLEVFDVSTKNVAGVAGWSGSALLGLIHVPDYVLNHTNPKGKKGQRITVTFFPQRGFSGRYFNVYKGKKYLGTVDEKDTPDILASAVRPKSAEGEIGEQSTLSVIESKLKKVLVKPERKKSKLRKKKFKPPYHVDVSEERGGVDIYLDDSDGNTIAEWHDADVTDMVESGYFNPRDLENSVLDYAESVGLI